MPTMTVRKQTARKKAVAPGAPATNELPRTQLEFRQAMAHLAAAVNVITSDGPAGKLGITASSVSSVTDSPPTVLACINRNSAAHDIFLKNGRIAINVLSSDQAELARHFAGMTGVPMPERFEWDIWDSGHAAPVLSDSRVALIGRIAESVEQGTHTVLFIHVESTLVREDKDGLVYYGREFHRVGTSSSDTPS